MNYRFATKLVVKPHRTRRAIPKIDKTGFEETQRKPEDVIGVVQGQTPDSLQEWWVALALNRLGIPYTYQYPINGGRTRGGYLVDFVVYTVPLATMIEPVGNHWHTGELGADDKKRQADVESAMQDICRTPINNLWIPDLLDADTTYNVVRKILYG